MTKTATKKPKRTLYFDEKDSRWVLIVWNGERARHHKLPRDLHTEAAAKKYAKPLGMERHFA